jgi:DNA polymerase I-like protein with 3'-5' exonuclease and polymerase domains
MIHFIINRPHEVHPEEGELVIQSTLSEDDINYIINLPVTGFDYEANDLDPFIAQPILIIIGDKERQYVIDCETYDCISLLARLPEDKLILGANLKYDYKIAKVSHKHTFAKMYDVMVAEQRLLQGLVEYNVKAKKVLGISCSLESITQRRLGILPKGMDKSVRNEFIGANPKTFVFRNKHVQYGAGDIIPLFEIRDKQKERIKERNLEFLIYGIEFPLIRELADAELEGLEIDREKWLDNIKFNEEQKFEHQCKLDAELKRLRDTVLPPNERQYLTGGLWDRERRKSIPVIQNSLFGEDEVETIKVFRGAKKGKKKYKKKAVDPYINYSSPPQLVTILGRLKQAVPTKDGKYYIPTFYYNTKSKKEVLNKDYSFTTGKGTIESYLVENPNTPVEEFIKLLIKYRTFCTRLNTFGEGFLFQYKNPITGRYYTIYRQCDAITGRLQSGDRKNGWFNSQNIPAEKRYREAFICEEDWDMYTTDLSGAEAVIMIDKARDQKFYEMAIVNDDAHSPLATAVWRAIYDYRSKQVDLYSYEELHEFSVKALTFVVSKTENKHLRTAFKPITFGTIYGMYPKKFAKTLNVSIEEAKVGIATIKRMIPNTFGMVEKNARFALNNGYLVLNNRTNSRVWYEEVLKAKKSGSDLEFTVSSDIASSARNSPIQGTQADMVKEMIIEINKELRRQNLQDKAKFLLQVHDELVYKAHKDIGLLEFVNDDKTKPVELVSFGDFKKKWMCQVANRYLSFIKMTAEQHKGKTWTK